MGDEVRYTANDEWDIWGSPKQKGIIKQLLRDSWDVGVVSISQGASLESFPSQVPEVDDSARFTRALNSLGSNGGTIIIPQGKTYTGNFTLSKSNVVIAGGGTLKGTLLLHGDVTSVGDRFTKGTNNITIQDITIDGQMLYDGISIQYIIGLSINKVIFKNCVRSVYFEKVPVTQHSARIKITDNRFIDCNYGLYVDYVAPTDTGKFPVGDITFSNNQYESRVSGAGNFGNKYHIWAKGLDGLICKGNVFFFASTGQEVSNIYIDTFNWTILEGNNIFVPPNHGIEAYNGSNLLINNNNFAWTGKESVWISNVTTCSVDDNLFSWKDDNSVLANRTGVYVENCPYFIGTINNNKFYFPNEYAISIKDSGNITITGNTARNKYSVNEPVKINSFATCPNIHIGGNTFTGYTKTLETVLSALGTNTSISFSGNNEGKPNINRSVHAPIYKVFSSNATSIDVSSSNLIVFANTVATTITSLTTEDLNNTHPRLITIYSYNANTSISRTIPSVIIKGTGASVTIPARESMTLLVYGGTIQELNRSFPVT